MKSESVKVNRGVLRLAIEEADELLSSAILVDKTISLITKASDSDEPIGKMLTANILVGLSIEIYLKSFMIAGRDDGVVKGHNLKELYDELPYSLKKDIEGKFDSYDKSNFEPKQIALTISEKRPDTPDNSIGGDIDVNDFNSCITSLSNTFVESRYFFENINDKDWAIINYYFESAKLIAECLKSVLNDFINRKFKGLLGV